MATPIYLYKNRLQATIDGDTYEVEGQSVEEFALNLSEALGISVKPKLVTIERLVRRSADSLRGEIENGAEHLHRHMLEEALRQKGELPEKTPEELSAERVSSRKQQLEKLRKRQKELRKNIGLPIKFEDFRTGQMVPGRIKSVVLHKHVPQLLYKIETYPDGQIKHKRTTADFVFAPKDFNLWKQYDIDRQELIEGHKELRKASTRLKRTQKRIEAMQRKVEEDRRKLQSLINDVKEKI